MGQPDNGGKDSGASAPGPNGANPFLLDNAGYSSLLLDRLPDGIVAYDGQGRVIYANEAFERLYGWLRAELYGKRMDAFIPPHDLEHSADYIRRAVAGEPITLLTQRLHRDGHLIDIELRSVTYHDADGSIAGIYVVHRDLTEILATRSALEETERRYRKALDASPDSIAVYDAQGRITYVNPSFTKTFGWTFPELAGKGIDFVPEHERQRTFDAVQRTLKGEEVFLDTQRMTKDGRLLDIQLATAIFKDSQGNLLGDIVIYRDVTPQKTIERELTAYRDQLENRVAERTRELDESLSQQRSALEAARENEERFRELAELLPEIVFEMDLGERLTFVNRRALETMGYSDEQFQRGIFLADILAPADIQTARANAAKILSGENRLGNEYTLRRKDGTTFPAMAFSTPILKGGKPAGLRGIIVDVSRPKELERQLRHAAKMEAIGTLAGGIAHDFNNLLQAIDGYVQMLLIRETLDPAVRTPLTNIERAIERAGDLVRRLLAFGRPGETPAGPFDLNAEVEQTVVLLDRTLPKMVRIRLDLDPDLPPVRGDAAQLSQVLMNLAANARDAMPDGGELSLSTRSVARTEKDCAEEPGLPPGMYALLTVTDTGQGMTAEAQRHLFEPFFTTKAVGKGTGLGLAMAYGVVKSHGGDIRCTSTVGKGTSFHILLPLHEQAAEDAQPADEPPLQPLAPRSLPGETILLVDDEEWVREVGVEGLTRLGYHVLCAESGEKALDILAKDPRAINAVVLDLGMPGMGGRKCMELIRERWPGQKILVASGYGTEFQAKGILDAGADSFLSKPYRIKDLNARLREVLDATPA